MEVILYLGFTHLVLHIINLCIHNLVHLVDLRKCEFCIFLAILIPITIKEPGFSTKDKRITIGTLVQQNLGDGGCSAVLSIVL